MTEHTDDDINLSEVLDDRSDIADLRPLIKEAAAARREAGEDVQVEDLLALTRKNDTAYISPADIEKAQWAARMYDFANERHQEQRDSGDLDERDMDWTEEGDIEMSPRKLHYFLSGSGAELRDGSAYENDTRCWSDLREGLRWAQLIGLVDPDAIKDKQNNAPQGPAIEVDDGRGVVSNPRPNADIGPGDVLQDRVQPFHVDTGYRPPNVPRRIERPELKVNSAEHLLERVAEDLVDAAFEYVRYDALAHQPYYIEVWCEKSDIIPKSLSEDYGVTRRAAGGGEMSYHMCREAIEIAAARDQDLVIILATDFDPKGRDMPRSTARKCEVEAAFHDTEVRVHHAGVTREQAITYDLRTTPAKDPTGRADNPGRKAYEGHTRLFEDAAGQNPVEVDAFAGDHPGPFRAAIEAYIQPYYDDELADRIDAATAQAKQDALDELRETFAEDVPAVADALTELERAVDAYLDRMNPGFEAAEDSLRRLREQERQVRRELGIDAKRDEVKDAITDDYAEALREIGVDLPEPDVDEVADPLLDTHRGFFEQAEWYDVFDIRE